MYSTITRLRRYPALPWILPFAVFVLMLGVQKWVAIPPSVRFFVSMATVVAVSREPLRGRPGSPLMSILLGLAVFAIWIGPDVIAPSWRASILFDNPIFGHPAGNTPPAAQHDPGFLFFRIAISVIAVPLLEELFWRGWLMRWLINDRDFLRVPMGTFAPMAFWVTAVLFASEHGPYWDVGLIAGVIYNAWMVRTHNLWDCIIAHAVTNGALAAWVVFAGQWQYWL